MYHGSKIRDKLARYFTPFRHKNQDSSKLKSVIICMALNFSQGKYMYFWSRNAMERELLGSIEVHSLNFCLEMFFTFLLSQNIVFVEANIFTDHLNNHSKLLRSRGNSENGLSMFKKLIFGEIKTMCAN